METLDRLKAQLIEVLKHHNVKANLHSNLFTGFEQLKKCRTCQLKGKQWKRLWPLICIKWIMTQYKYTTKRGLGKERDWHWAQWYNKNRNHHSFRTKQHCKTAPFQAKQGTKTVILDLLLNRVATFDSEYYKEEHEMSYPIRLMITLP